jgi:hypothetical protein
MNEEPEMLYNGAVVSEATYILALASSEWGKSRGNSIKVADILVEILTEQSANYEPRAFPLR